MALLSLVCFALGVFAPGTAAADLTPEQMERLEGHINNANQAEERGNHQRAAEEWAAAAELADHPRIHLRLANAQVDLNQCSAARQVYEQVGRMGDLSDDVQRERDELRGRLDTCSEPGELYFECTPRELTLEVDGQPWTCSQWQQVEPGTYRARATHPGYETENLSVRIDDGQRVEETIQLRADQLAGEQESIHEDSSRSSLLYPGLGMSGLGGLLIGVGVFREGRTTERAQQMQAARDDGDFARMDELRDEADSARSLTKITYGVGALALSAGAGMTIYSLLSSSGEDEPSLSLGITNSGFELYGRF